jgi:hypothetical protein
MFRIRTPDSTGDVDPNWDPDPDPGRQKLPPPPEKKEINFLFFDVLDILSGVSGGFSCRLKGFHEGLEYIFFN